MFVLLIMELLTILLLFIISRNKFNDEILPDDTGKNGLKLLLPVGFMVLRLFRHKYRTGYEKKLEVKIRYLKGAKHAHAFLKIHMAQKVVLIMMSIVFITFIGSLTGIDPSFAVFSLIVPGSLFYAIDKNIDKKIKVRTRSMQMDFPEFLNKLILLVNAGLTVTAALQRIVKEGRKERPLYTELKAAINEINSGKPEIQAYSDFAARCRLYEITAFTSALIQNLRKGNDRLIPVLRLQAAACWENRKNIARKLGEEASVKLLIPMVIVFIAILIMMVAPAVMQLKI